MNVAIFIGILACSGIGAKLDCQTNSVGTFANSPFEESPTDGEGKCETYEDGCDHRQDEDGDGHPDETPQNPDDPGDQVP